MTFSWPVRIYYEDTDAGGIVYYPNYLKYAERARTEWLRKMGYDQHALWQSHDVGFVVKHCTTDYKLPARLDDLLAVTCECTRLSRSSFVMKQQVWRDDMLLASMEIVLVCVNRDIRPVRLPDDIRAALEYVAN